MGSQHDPTDLDASVFAGHHSLGPKANQAAPGNHKKHYGDTDWIPITGGIGYSNGWVDFGAPWAIGAYCVKDNWIEFQGLLKSGVSGTTGFTLPDVYRPLADLMFGGVSGAIGGALALTRIDVQAATGSVILNGGNGFLSLTGIRYPKK